MGKIGLALWSLGHVETVDQLRRKIEVACDIGVKAVQLWCVDRPGRPCLLDPDRCRGDKRLEVKEIIHSYGLEISGLCAQLEGPATPGKGWPGSALGDPRGLRERIEKTKGSLKLAADLECRIVTAHIGEIPQDKSDTTYKTMRESCVEIARFGEDVGAVFCIETGQEPVEVLRIFIEDVNSEALKVNYDPANILRRYGARSVVEGVRTLAPWIVHTHAKDYDPKTGKQTVGEGDVPWSEYISALREVGYDGWYILEDESGKDIISSLKKGKAFLEKMLS